MLEFYCTPDCPRCGHLQDVLEELCIAHKVVLVEPPAAAPNLPPGTKLPALLDEAELFEGGDAILSHPEELATFKDLWYQYQSDACYCGEPGKDE